MQRCTSVALLGWLTLTAASAHATPLEEQSQLRRPVAMVLSADAQRLWVANQRSGSISSIDLASQQVSGEIAVGRRLSDLRSVAGTRLLLACDEAAHCLLLLEEQDDGTLAMRQRLDVAAYPVQVSVTADGRQAVVASLWSRRLTFVNLPQQPRGEAEVHTMLDLPFAPRCLKLAEQDTRLIVGDAFGGQIGIVSMADQHLLHTRELPGHNIRGIDMGVNGEMVVVAHQMLNELAHTIRNDVHWGLLMSNDLRWLRLQSLLSPDADLYKKAHMHPLGHAGSATGDPSGLAVAANGLVVVAMGGVDEIAIGREDDFNLHRLKVGRRPTAIAIADGGSRAYVANTFGDSVSIVDLQQREVTAEISLGPRPELTLAERGELLFYDARLSHDSWMSCHSCHSDGHTNGLMSDNLSDASFGAPKRVLSLLGIAETAPFAWNAGAASLEEQIHKSIEITMQSDNPPQEDQVAALAAFVRSLPAAPPLTTSRGNGDSTARARGEALFARLDCAGCHQPPQYTSQGVYDVGLQDKQGNREFNPPSLRGVSQRGPYFHDNSALTLEDVFRQHRHQLAEPLSEAELQDLLAFLRSL